MAKQSGIHQLRGKVGEMSYYRRKGVVPGLVRGINAGMSERVKYGEEYANTRLNNDEFRTANQLATFAFNAVNTRKRGMLRDFAIAYMTKSALQAIRQGTAQWGFRRPNIELDLLIADMLENYAKGGKYDGQYGSYSVTPLSAQGTATINFSITTEISKALEELGVSRLLFVPSKGLAGYSIIAGELPHLFAGSAIGAPQDEQLDIDEDIDVPISISVGTPVSVGMSPSGYTFAKEDSLHGFFASITILPIRVVNGGYHVMQELATYVAIPLGKMASE